MDDEQRFERAAIEVKAALQKTIRQLRPKLRKHKLSPRSLELAITKGAGLNAAACAKHADVPLTAMDIEGA